MLICFCARKRQIEGSKKLIAKGGEGGDGGREKERDESPDQCLVYNGPANPFPCPCNECPAATDSRGGGSRHRARFSGRL